MDTTHSLHSWTNNNYYDVILPLSIFNISSSFTVQNLRTRLVKIDHVCFGYLATTSLLSVLLSITHKKRALYKNSTSEDQNKCVYKWKKLAS